MYRCKFECQKIQSPNNQILKYWVLAPIADSLPVRQSYRGKGTQESV